MILETQIIVISTSEHLHAKKKSEFKPYTFHIIYSKWKWIMGLNIMCKTKTLR